MCAIAGILGLPCNSDTQRKLLNTMRRRGPDGEGVAEYPGCVLLHTRLAIIDPELGKQPMSLRWGQEEYTISYNGELYNTRELRCELESLGHSFLTHSDTEVLLHAYVQWKDACLERLNGIFAFAVWESRSECLFLARDRMGVKPLFYKKHFEGLLFSSEIKTILAYPGVKAQLDAQGAAQLLLLGPGRKPGSGVFKGIQELEPGCCAYFRDGRLGLRRYWQLHDREHDESFEETAAHVRDLVTDSIKRQMVSDVPIGTFLSGGLDSSLISAVCAGHFAKVGKRLDTFSVDYADNDKYFTPDKFQPNADGTYIRIMQEHLNSRHHWSVLTVEELVSSLEDATRARDLPGMADVDFSLLAFCKEIRKDVKVALSGECADEIFGGYPWYRDPEVRALEGFPWAQNTQLRASVLHPAHQADIDCRAYVNDCYRETVSRADILPGTTPENRRIKEMVVLNQYWFMQTLLDRKDRMSMHWGLEVRVPFCDHRIAEYLYGVPLEFKDYRGREKGLLRAAMEGVLPDEVLHRKKSPYPKTWDPGYLELLRRRLQGVLAEQHNPLFDLVDRNGLLALLDGQQPWPWYGQLMRLPQTIAYMLQLEFWLREYRVSLV